jgi:DNA-directed RNA polymerase specialized sigma24 family protein
MSQPNALPLTLRQRKVCVLAWVEGMTDAAIATEHGVATRTVESRLYRARRRMREAGLEPLPRRWAKIRARALQLGELENA